MSFSVTWSTVNGISDAEKNKSLGLTLNACVFWHENVTTKAFEHQHKLPSVVSFNPKLSVFKTYMNLSAVSWNALFKWL